MDKEASKTVFNAAEKVEQGKSVIVLLLNACAVARLGVLCVLAFASFWKSSTIFYILPIVSQTLISVNSLGEGYRLR